MPGLTVNVQLQDIKKLETNALIVGFFEDVRPLAHLAGELDWLLCGALSSLIINQKLRGSLGDVALLTSRGKVPAQKIFLVGLGPSATVTTDSLRNVARNAISSTIAAGVKDMALECFSTPSLSADEAVTAIMHGAADGSRGMQANLHLLAPDAARYEQISKLVAPWHERQLHQNDFSMPEGTAASKTDTRRNVNE